MFLYVVCDVWQVYTLQALGAKVIRTPISAGSYDLEGLMAQAQLLAKDIPDAVVLDQVHFNN